MLSRHGPDGSGRFAFGPRGVLQRLLTSPFGQRVKWNIFGTLAGRLFGPLAQIVIARYLDPSLFGLFALGVAWLALFDVIKDFGLNHAIIVDEHSGDFVSLQFFVELSVATFMFCLTLVIAPLLSALVEQPDLENVLRSMSVIMFINAIADPLVTRHMKNQDYRVLAVRQVAIPVIMGLTGIALVWLDFGVYALVVGLVAGNLGGCIWLVAADRGVSRPRWDRQRFGQLFLVGKHVLIQRIAGYLTSNADSFTVGSLLGAGPLGIYRLGNQLAFLMPTVLIAPITQVAFTDVSNRREPAHIDRRYYQYSYFTGVLMLVYSVGAYFAAPVLVPLVLGEQWLSVVPILQLFCIVMTTGFMASINAELAKVLGFAGIYTRYTIVRSVLTLLAVMIAAGHSLYAAVIAWVVAGIIANLVNDVIFYQAQQLVRPRWPKTGLVVLGWLWAVFVLLRT